MTEIGVEYLDTVIHVADEFDVDDELNVSVKNEMGDRISFYLDRAELADFVTVLDYMLELGETYAP